MDFFKNDQLLIGLINMYVFIITLYNINFKFYYKCMQHKSIFYYYIKQSNFFVFLAEVEKQLQGSVTPQLPYKKPHGGSTGSIHNLVLISDQAVAGMFVIYLILFRLIIIFFLYFLFLFQSVAKNNFISCQNTINCLISSLHIYSDSITWFYC